MYPWTTRTGQFAPFRAAVFASLFLPALWIGWRLATGLAGPRPITDAIHLSGDWAIRLLLITLAITPLRRLTRWNRLIGVRRMLGVASCVYAVLHLGLYALDQNGNLLKIVSEIALRFYLTIGFVALLGLGALAATSTDGAIRRLGKRWSRLHSLVYILTPLALLHFFLQTKLDVFEPTVFTGLFLLMMGARLIVDWRGALTPATLLLLAVVTALATAGLEYAWYGLATGVPPGRILSANLSLAAGLRPAWWVLIVGLASIGVLFTDRLTVLSSFLRDRKRLTSG